MFSASAGSRAAVGDAAIGDADHAELQPIRERQQQPSSRGDTGNGGQSGAGRHGDPPERQDLVRGLLEGSTGDVVGQNKEAPFNMATYLRLYPGVSGMATNGLRWGANAEVRENFKGVGFEPSQSFATISIIATNAQNSSTAMGTSGLTCAQTLHVWRASVWVAQDKIGIVRLGQDDGVVGLFDAGIGTFQNVAQCLWDGDAPGAVNGNTAPTYPWCTLQGAEYGSNKIVYLSPQFAGVDFGFNFAPNNGNGIELTCANA